MVRVRNDAACGNSCERGHSACRPCRVHSPVRHIDIFRGKFARRREHIYLEIKFGVLQLVSFPITHTHTHTIATEFASVPASLRAPSSRRSGVFLLRLFYVRGHQRIPILPRWYRFAIAGWSLPAASFALYTLANLVPRARKVCMPHDLCVQLHHHRGWPRWQGARRQTLLFVFCPVLRVKSTASSFTFGKMAE